MGRVGEPRLEDTTTSETKKETDAGSSPGFFEVDSNRVRLLRDGREAYPAMLDAIGAARREVLLEMYWIQGDRAGLMFRDALPVQFSFYYDLRGGRAN